MVAEMSQKICQILVEDFSLPAQPSEDSRLLELGLDSLDLINFLFKLEEIYGVKVPDEALADGSVDSIADLAKYLSNGQ